MDKDNDNSYQRGAGRQKRCLPRAQTRLRKRTNRDVHLHKQPGTLSVWQQTVSVAWRGDSTTLLVGTRLPRLRQTLGTSKLMAAF